MLTQDDVITILYQGNYLKIFATAIRTALQDWLDIVAKNPDKMEGAISLEKSTFLNRRVIEIVKHNLENDSNAVFTPSHQSHLLTIEDKITLRFKKLDRRGRPMNIPTSRVKRLWHHNEKLLPGDFEEWINVTVGWKLTAVGTIHELLIVSDLGNGNRWTIPISEDGVITPENHPLQLPIFDAEVPAYSARVNEVKRAQRANTKDNEVKAND